MSEQTNELGSKAWQEEVWSSPPVDTIKGRTRWTQAHGPWCDALARHAPVQGRLEYCTLVLLEYLVTLRLVVRFKEHAFATTKNNLGWEVRPDFFAYDSSNRLLVIETKTARFVTQEVQLQLDANQKGLEKYGLKYLVWTDRHPLTRPVRHNLINMRRGASEDVADAEILRLGALVQQEGEIPLSAVVERGFDMTCIFAAWWKGHVFLTLTRDVNSTSLLRPRSHENLKAIFLDETVAKDRWWETLPGV